MSSLRTPWLSGGRFVAWMTGHRAQGEALARVVEAALTTAGRLPYATEAIADLDGQTWRAEEYGHVGAAVLEKEE